MLKQITQCSVPGIQVVVNVSKHSATLLKVSLAFIFVLFDLATETGLPLHAGITNWVLGK